MAFEPKETKILARHDRILIEDVLRAQGIDERCLHPSSERRVELPI